MSLYPIFTTLLLLFSLTGRDQNPGLSSGKAQIAYLDGNAFIQRNITGRGVRIAVLDGGFPGVDTIAGLHHLVTRGQIKATWDFVRNREDVYHGAWHGTAVLSCIAGRYGDQSLGLSPDAEFLLALTEKKGEPLSEEINFAHAVDWAIENGADIIQSSLGYTYQRYFPADLDGRHSIAAKAVAKAARQGILIVNCNGNEGMSKWRTLVTPADADSILSVGAIDPETGLAAAFSSLGPTADKRLKPNVCAPGKVLVLIADGSARLEQGTSFSAPLVTGFAACVWQIHPDLTAQQILNLVEQSGHLYPYYDYSHGYGIPQASRILLPGETGIGPEPILSSDGSRMSITIHNPDHQTLPPPLRDYLYYHVSEPSGFLTRYGVYRMDGKDSVSISLSGMKAGESFRCYFNGKTASWTDQK